MPKFVVTSVFQNATERAALVHVLMVFLCLVGAGFLCCFWWMALTATLLHVNPSSNLPNMRPCYQWFRGPPTSSSSCAWIERTVVNWRFSKICITSTAIAWAVFILDGLPSISFCLLSFGGAATSLTRRANLPLNKICCPFCGVEDAFMRHFINRRDLDRRFIISFRWWGPSPALRPRVVGSLSMPTQTLLVVHRCRLLLVSLAWASCSGCSVMTDWINRSACSLELRVFAFIDFASNPYRSRLSELQLYSWWSTGKLLHSPH